VTVTATLDHSPARQAVLEALGVAARNHALDLQVKLAGEQAVFLLNIDGQPREAGGMPAASCEEFMTAAWAVADGDGAFQYGTYQSAKMTGEKAPLPPDISVIHLQFSPRKDGARHLVARFTRSGDTCCGTCGG